MSGLTTLPLKVALIEPEPAVRSGVCYHLQQFPAFEVAFEIDSVARGESLFGGQPPHVTVVDVDLDGGGGLHLIKRLQSPVCRIPCVAWLRRTQRRDVLAAMKVRAKGIVTRREPLDELVLAIMSVVIGYTHLSQAAALALYDGAAETTCQGVAALPARQLQVFRLIGEGFGPGEIASRLGIVAKTVHTHIERLKVRFGCRNQAALARLAAIESVQTD